ncbi:MAG: DUF1476 domain-containing protein [Rhodobacteraceae bacterium]|nr:DUF1476 domain-containing protein [Paracoccaceae bacterium]
MGASGENSGGPTVTTTFDDRERAFEAKYALDSEMRWRAEARANRLLGGWAAGLMGLTGKAAEDYVRGVVKADLEEAGHEDVVRKVTADLAGRADAAEVRRKLAELQALAKGQLLEEG